MSIQLWELARNTMKRAAELGAEESVVSVGRNTEISLTRRAGRLEQAHQATSLSLSLSLLVDDRFSGHSTSDLRPEALESFLQSAVAATRALEPEPERRQVDRALCGHGATLEELDGYDAGWVELTVAERRNRVKTLEELVDALPTREQIISATCYHADSEGESVRVMSNGFEGEWRSTGFGHGVDMTLFEPGGRRPEAMSWYGAPHAAMLPSPEAVVQEAWKKAARRLGSKPAKSGRYPMLLENSAAGRILGVMGAPLSGSELHQGRSFYAGKLGTQIASPVLNILDDPLIPRAPGSRPFDGDGIMAKPMPVIEDGVLKNYYINVYYGRKLGMAPTTGGRSNWVIRPGTRTALEMAKDLPVCIMVTGFLGGNSNGVTGDFSFGIQGLLLEHGEVVGNLSEMNVSGNIGDIYHRLVETGSDVWTWSGVRSPSLLFEGVEFRGE
jgi:PmbA protein